jgi:hypothetical protein
MPDLTAEKNERSSYGKSHDEGSWGIASGREVRGRNGLSKAASGWKLENFTTTILLSFDIVLVASFSFSMVLSDRSLQ